MEPRDVEWMHRVMLEVAEDLRLTGKMKPKIASLLNEFAARLERAANDDGSPKVLPEEMGRRAGEAW